MEKKTRFGRGLLLPAGAAAAGSVFISAAGIALLPVVFSAACSGEATGAGWSAEPVMLPLLSLAFAAVCTWLAAANRALIARISSKTLSASS